MDNKEIEIDLLANYIDKVDYSRVFQDIAGERKHSLAMIAGDRMKMLNDLLCAIHGDIGQCIAEYGYKKATEEALNIVSKLTQQATK